MKVALFIKHQTRPGKRDDVRAIWERHLQPSIARNPGHEAYCYGFDHDDPDCICAFQQYASVEASQAFLRTDSYAAYLAEVGALLLGPPQITTITPVWIKGA